MKSWAKQKIQSFLRSRGLKITHNRNDQWPPDFDLLPILVESEGPGIKNLNNIVQIGANDGGHEDPLANTIAASSANAYLIEPLPDPYQKLEQLYKDNPRVTTINAALSETDGQATIWRVTNNADEAQQHTQYASFDRSVIDKFRPMFEPTGGKIVSQSVRTITVKTLLDQYSINTIDLLQVDTEGWDAKVVNWFLDGAATSPAVINYEHIHLPADQDQQLIQRLRSLSYKLVRYGRDTTAIHVPTA